jgi:hypothetical protein
MARTRVVRIPTSSMRVMVARGGAKIGKMRPATIVPGHHPGNPDVDPAKTERWAPSSGVRRLVDCESAPSAFPSKRRFETIYPGTLAAEEASAQMRRAREHDRRALERLAELVGDELALTIPGGLPRK